MIKVTDQYPLRNENHEGVYWIEMTAEITPHPIHLGNFRYIRPWWAEVMVVRLDQWNPPLVEGEFAIPYHYHTYDFSTFTLRGAMAKAWDVFDKLTDDLSKDMSEWPWPEKW